MKHTDRTQFLHHFQSIQFKFCKNVKLPQSLSTLPLTLDIAPAREGWLLRCSFVICQTHPTALFFKPIRFAFIPSSATITRRSSAILNKFIEASLCGKALCGGLIVVFFLRFSGLPLYPIPCVCLAPPSALLPSIGEIIFRGPWFPKTTNSMRGVDDLKVTNSTIN